MGKLRWYKRDPSAALAGMMELTLDERGAYNTCLDLIYDRDGDLPDDDRFIAGWLRVDLRVWRRIRVRLIDLGKLSSVDGQLHNGRADREILDGLSRAISVSELNRSKGHKSGAARRKINDLSEPRHKPKSNTTRTKKEDTSSLRSDDTPQTGEPKPERDRKNLWPQDYREQFWPAYPRRVDKKPALKALDRIFREDRVPWGPFIAAVRRYAESTRDTEARYIKHPERWLNAGSWEDETPAPRPPAQRTHSHAGKVKSAITECVDRAIDAAFTDAENDGGYGGEGAARLLSDGRGE